MRRRNLVSLYGQERLGCTSRRSPPPTTRTSEAPDGQGKKTGEPREYNANPGHKSQNPEKSKTGIQTLNERPGDKSDIRQPSWNPENKNQDLGNDSQTPGKNKRKSVRSKTMKIRTQKRNRSSEYESKSRNRVRTQTVLQRSEFGT